MIEYKKATYQASPANIRGRGMFFFTDCCNTRMYSVNNNDMFYHGKLCPKCFHEGKHVILYLRGTEEANKIEKEKIS